MAASPGYAPAILKGLGAPVTSRTLADLSAWQRSEGGSASNNPFNTSQGGFGGSDYNPSGVKNYPSPAVGIQATLKTLNNGKYGSILNALRAGGNPSAFAAAVGNSPWGSSGKLIASILGTTPAPTSLNPNAGQQLTPSASKPTGNSSAILNWLSGNTKSLLSGGFGSDPTALLKILSTTPAPAAAISSPIVQGAVASKPSGVGGGFISSGGAYTQERADQGRDLMTTPGGAIVAPGAGRVVRNASDPNGFGTSYPIVQFTSGPYAGKTVYIGHTRSLLKPGSIFNPGDRLSQTGTTGNEPWNGNASQPGWAEIGFAPGGIPGRFGQTTPF